MPDMDVHVDHSDADRELNIISAGLSDLSSFWPLLVPVVTSWWSRQFSTDGAFAGSPWSPLTPSYAAFKAAHAPGKGILVFTGAMKQAVSRPHRSQTPQSLTLSIDSEILGYHQEGAGRLPVREVVFGDPLPPEAQQELDDVAEEYVTDLVQRAGGG